MSQNERARPILLSVLLVTVACCMASGTALAQVVALKDAVQCNDFKHNRDGSWYAASVTLEYGPGKKNQMNLFGATIKKGKVDAGEPDLWTILNEKCGTASH